MVKTNIYNVDYRIKQNNRTKQGSSNGTDRNYIYIYIVVTGEKPPDKSPPLKS